MAQSLSPALPTQLSPAPSSVTRSTSITSTNSASSGVSLRRRARTKSKTLNSSGRRGKSLGPGGSSRQDASGSGDSAQVTAPRQSTLPVPTRSARKSVDAAAGEPSAVQEIVVPSTRERTYSAVHIREVPADAGRGRLSKSEGGSAKNPSRKSRGVSLPRSAFRNASSDESSEASPQTPTDFHQATFIRLPGRSPQAGVRDSMISSSSSLYPASTSSGSIPESSLLSPRDKDGDAASFAPHIVTSSDFDVDDVSYRLKLLVNNNYFLPPAHYKPSPLSLSPQAPAQDPKAAKSTTPGFFDFFRMGKSKSKPTTPMCHSPPALEKPPPLLRTTSDSTTAGGYVPRPPAASPPSVPAASPFSPAPANQNRVVVLRERMDDLMAAAKHAERDIKSRADGRKAQSLTSPKTAYDDVIDPTDAVDLPPPLMTSPLENLGPGEAIGADLLADRLPPSPGVWSMSSEEESWRKAILHEAVSLSLSESPEQSFVSMTPSSPEPTSPGSFRTPTEVKSEAPTSTPAPKPTALIGQRIMEPNQLDSAARGVTVVFPSTEGQPSSEQVSGNNGKRIVEKPWLSALSPPRAETPALATALTPPPPRREPNSPQHSASANDLHRSASMDIDGSRPRDTISTLRRAMSSPRLSAVSDETISPIDSPSESIGQRLSVVSPLPNIIPRDPLTLSTRPSTSSLLRASPLFSDDDDLSYVTPMDELEDESHVRPSMTLSIPTGGRPSMSEYSNPSPTASAFNDIMLQDAVFGSCRSPSPMHARRSHAGSITAGTTSSSTSTARPRAPARQSTLSPPPRESSTFGTPLPPPPRMPASRPIFRPSTASSHTSAHTTSTHSSAPLYSAAEPHSEVESNLQLCESPTSDRSPASALAERRGLPSILSLQIPCEVISPALHSAPAPASPTAFFDRIQSHPNAMDDLETSDESDNDEEVPVPMPPPVMPPPSPSVLAPSRMSSSSRSSVKGALARLSHSGVRPTIMRLGNHSSPHLTSGSDKEPFPEFDPDPRKPIGHIPEKGTFFTARTRKKSGKGQATFPLDTETSRAAHLLSMPGASTSTARSRSRSTTRRPATSGSVPEKARPGQRESLQKFDGMLLEHIAAERDTIKRITNNISSSRS